MPPREAEQAPRVVTEVRRALVPSLLHTASTLCCPLRIWALDALCGITVFLRRYEPRGGNIVDRLKSPVVSHRFLSRSHTPNPAPIHGCRPRIREGKPPPIVRFESKQHPPLLMGLRGRAVRPTVCRRTCCRMMKSIMEVWLATYTLLAPGVGRGPWYFTTPVHDATKIEHMNSVSERSSRRRRSPSRSVTCTTKKDTRNTRKPPSSSVSLPPPPPPRQRDPRRLS
jgi:hypothetical protein